jgi:hypothetical protein
MKICVLCRARRLGPDPYVFYLAQRRHYVVAILDRWTEPPLRYFDVRAEDGRRFVLCHDPATQAWQLVGALPKKSSARFSLHWQERRL